MVQIGPEDNISEYLKKGWGERRWRRVVRFRMRSKIRERVNIGRTRRGGHVGCVGERERIVGAYVGGMQGVERKRGGKLAGKM